MKDGVVGFLQKDTERNFGDFSLLTGTAKGENCIFHNENRVIHSVEKSVENVDNPCGKWESGME